MERLLGKCDRQRCGFGADFGGTPCQGSEEKRIPSEWRGPIAKNCADRVDCLFLAQGAMGRKNPCFSAVENSQKKHLNGYGCRYGLTMGYDPAILDRILSMPFPVFAINILGLLGCVWRVSRDDKGMS